MSDTPFRTGFVAIVGRPNVGKSTLTNALIGSKISIVSRKAQTTRHRIHGVLTRDHEQFVFVDTPGFQTRHGGAMNRMMNRVVTQALADVDVVVHVVEAGKWSEGDAKLLPLLPAPERTILAVSKIDALKNRDELFAFVSKIMALHPFGAVVPVSATKNQQLDQLLQEIAARLPEGEPMFEEDTLTDRPMRFIAAELVREKIFRLVGDELPYGCTVVIEQWEETDKGARIAACVVVERDSHKPILLGTGGMHMKRIASEARQDIAKLLDKPVHLEIYIKVRKGWSDRESALRDLGYE
ncbi:GTPase Era [Achromobacter xylosoxidans]|jgi:GTP-binding protein Era|uniref:GTPase Era n=2 Tax=Alcaligenes xylosoxydans xylosoxydans TaxID=85698 RepID=A0A0D6GLU0_ALCXX|nr:MULTISPECIES: GTPase Era [Pseudomonadota]AHC45934.1 GTP-binding protein Era [Achromobacter xylosoxidans NBRC 15126 = ATCC 27061]AMH06297.1 GTPase Era [Achromobacter xylosoxidans]AXA76215.1 GTPase Era [Achromobacter xylosoxidans]EFV82494.1 GTP-binding protein [Achromobacter xylosoxidans C54]KAA5918722.1 GTPase Era [Achromobacter xylosoxidans]